MFSTIAFVKKKRINDTSLFSSMEYTYSYNNI